MQLNSNCGVILDERFGRISHGSRLPLDFHSGRRDRVPLRRRNSRAVDFALLRVVVQFDVVVLASGVQLRRRHALQFVFAQMVNDAGAQRVAQDVGERAEAVPGTTTTTT